MVKGSGRAASLLWILRPFVSSCPSLSCLPATLTRVTHLGGCSLGAGAHVPSCKLHERLFVMKRRHNKEEERCIKDLPWGLEFKRQFSWERLWFPFYILQKWMVIRMTDRIMMFHSNVDNFYFSPLGLFHSSLLYFSHKKGKYNACSLWQWESSPGQCHSKETANPTKHPRQDWKC